MQDTGVPPHYALNTNVLYAQGYRHAETGKDLLQNIYFYPVALTLYFTGSQEQWPKPDVIFFSPKLYFWIFMDRFFLPEGTLLSLE